MSPKQTNYEKGVRVERLARKHLEAKGYFVMRSAGSKGPCDLIAIDKVDVLLIQIKVQGAAKPEDVEKLKAVPAPESVSKEIWEYVGRGQWRLYWHSHPTEDM